jgi:hypothetical protein
MADGRGRILWHGTTRKRAESILRHGPNPNFQEPGEILTRAEGFSTAAPEGPFLYGSPALYAARKAALFPDEGGPAILEMEVPWEIADLAITEAGPGDVRFVPGYGLEELLAAWPSLPKRIL